MNNGVSKECSFNKLIAKKRHERSFEKLYDLNTQEFEDLLDPITQKFEDLHDPNTQEIIAVRYKIGCPDGNYNKENLNGTLVGTEKVVCRHMAAIQLERMKKTGTFGLKCLQTREEIQEIWGKIDLEKLADDAQPALREIIASEHIGQYLYKLHAGAKGNRTCVYIDTTRHALAVCIEELDRYIVIVSYDPNHTFLNKIVMEEKSDIEKIDFKMLFYCDTSHYKIIKSQVCMDRQYQAYMTTIIQELEKKGRERHARRRDNDSQAISDILIGEHLWRILYIIGNTDRHDQKDYLQLINKIKDNPGIWDGIKKKVYARIDTTTSYYEIVTLLAARDLLIREYCNQIKKELRNCTCDSENLSAIKKMLTCDIVTAGKTRIFKIPFAILHALDNRFTRRPFIYMFLRLLTYLIIINAILLPIENSVRKTTPYGTTKYNIIEFYANFAGAAIITSIFICAFIKHVHGQMPYSNNFKKEQLRAIKEKQAESKSNQTGSASRAIEEPLLISVASNDIGNNPNTQGTSNFFTKNDRSGYLHPQPYNASIRGIL